MTRQRLRLGEDIQDWWDRLHWPTEADIVLRWSGGGALRLGALIPRAPVLHYAAGWPGDLEPQPSQTPEVQIPDLGRLVGQALARAGWSRPQVETATLHRLRSVRDHKATRVEFIFDTNGMIHGVGHWLAEVFGDCCDLVFTSVTLRELQDKGDQANYKAGILVGRIEPNKKQGRTEVEWRLKPTSGKLDDLLAARQSYDSARRFLEFHGLRRPVWRELDLDDTALLLSRGQSKQGDKTSEADTLLLRRVRRYIQARVRGIERFFVTGDVALARRATTELPDGSVITARVRHAQPGQHFFPCRWWPTSAGARVVPWGQPMRLVRELLSLANEVDLVDADGRGYRFSAWSPEVGPADYVRPWMDVQALPAGGWAAPALSEPPASPPRPPSPFEAPGWWTDVPEVTSNLRITATLLFDALFALVRGGAGSTVRLDLPSLQGFNRVTALRRSHLAQLLETLQIGSLDEDGTRLHPLGRADQLTRAWRAGDRSTLFWMLAPFEALREVAEHGVDQVTGRPKATLENARTIASRLGFLARIDRQFHPGGGQPSLEQIRAAILEHFDTTQPTPSYSVQSLLLDVFLRRLHVSPSRVIDAWPVLKEAGVLDGLTFARGGDSTGAPTQRLASFGPEGVVDDTLDLSQIDRLRELALSQPRTAS